MWDGPVGARVTLVACCEDSNVSLSRTETQLTVPVAFFGEKNVSVLRNALDFPSSVSEGRGQIHYTAT